MRAAALSPSARAGAAGAAAVIAGAWACLPDLELVAPPGPVCGDGVISPDAGEQCDPGPDASAFATLCDKCKVECDLASGNLPFSDQVSHHCYFSYGNATEPGAIGVCEQNGAHVVRFVSAAEVSFVAAKAGTTYWIGLSDLEAGAPAWIPSEPTNEPGWSPKCPGCFANVDAGATDIPEVGDAGRRCAKGASGTSAEPWSQVACRASTLLPLCEREPVGTRTVRCAQGACFTVAATQGLKRYVVASSRLDASAASAACEAMGGELVVFATREEREQVAYEIGSQTVLPGKVDFWIGLSAPASGVWSWEGDAGGLAPLPWAVGEPSGAALARRAYVVLAPGAVDSELAHAQATAAEQHNAVCELR